LSPPLSSICKSSPANGPEALEVILSPVGRQRRVGDSAGALRQWKRFRPDLKCSTAVLQELCRSVASRLAERESRRRIVVRANAADRGCITSRAAATIQPEYDALWPHERSGQRAACGEIAIDIGRNHAAPTSLAGSTQAGPRMFFQASPLITISPQSCALPASASCGHKASYSG